jgi:type VI secretion system protein ImpL
MSKASWLRIIAYVVGAGCILALLWFAAPLLQVGEFRPFDNPIYRIVGMVGIGLGAFASVVYDIRYRMQSTAELARSMSPGGFGLGGGGSGSAGGTPATAAGPADDSETLKTRMSDALTTLKKSSSAKGDYLYDLPWYVIIGPPGSGKTTALVNSGLKFPLTRGGATPAAIAGEGGTRYCDWWFTEDAVLIDTAGRYTTQDSDAAADKSSWTSFLDLLKKNRPKQPINGVFVCISIEDVLSLQTAEVRAHADAIRARLMELHDQLKVDFPVYALFTKADLMSGFMEFFGHFNEADRKVVWGATFQTKDKTANLVNSVPEEFDLLIERLNHDVVDRIQEEPNPTARVQLLGFPSQVAALKEPVFNFLNWIFEPTRYHSNATLRGFYFASGTQQGTPIDQLIGALARSFGTQDVGTVQYSGLGKSFFLTDLLQKVVFEESGWVSTNVKAVRRAMIMKALGYTALATVCLGAVGAWWMSYGKNTTLIADVYKGVTVYKTKSAVLRDETVIADHDLQRINDPLFYLRNLPAGYAFHNEKSPTTATFGLDQRPRLNASGESAYDIGLLRLLRPRLLFRLEDMMRAKITDPGFLSEALKIYLMMGGKERMEKPRMLEWWRQDLEVMVPGAGSAAFRQTFMEHVSRLLDLDPPEGVGAIELDAALLQEAQSAIGRMSVSDRAFEILRQESRNQTDRDWVAQRKGGQDMALVFDVAGGNSLESIRIPYFYTYAGFQDAFLPKIATVTERVKQERSILGTVAAQTPLQQQYDNLPQALMERYSREFVAVWRSELSKLRMKLLTADKPRYLSLQAAAAPTSPLTQLIESIREETALTKERPAQQNAPAGQPQKAPPQRLVLPNGEVPGQQVENAFRAYALLVEGDRQKRPVDELVRVLNDMYVALTMLNDPVQMAQGRMKFAESLRTLEVTATRFPEPFKALIQAAGSSFDSDATGTTVARINQALNDQVTGACQELINNVYPFTRTSAKDMSLQDFQKLFGPNGILDRFFNANLAQYASTGGNSWSWVQTNPVARQMSPTMLQSFQRANEIKQAFFPSGAPGFNFAVKNLLLGPDVELARLEINSGQLVTERPKSAQPPPSSGFGSLFGSAPPPQPPPPPPGPAPVVTFQWPGPVGMGGVQLTLLPEQPGRAPLRRPGVWGIFRLLNEVSVTSSGPALIARISTGGREVQYQINAVSLPNPFTLNALRSFTCPVAR